MGRKNTLKVNMIEEPPKPAPLPVFRFEVAIFCENSAEIPLGLEIIDVFAQGIGSDGDELNFYEFKDDEEILIASFKHWTYFIRRESEADIAALKWGRGFEKIKKVAEDSGNHSVLI